MYAEFAIKYILEAMPRAFMSKISKNPNRINRSEEYIKGSIQRKNSRIMYHNTPSKNVSNILRTGLISNEYSHINDPHSPRLFDGMAVPKNHPAADTERSLENAHRVYMSSKPSSIRDKIGYGFQNSKNRDDGVVRLKFKHKGALFKDREVANNFPHFFSNSTVKPKDIIHISGKVEGKKGKKVKIR
jgi:hypothetical protein